MSNDNANSEKETLARLVDGDIHAFDDLYWKYQKAVYQNVFKLTKDTITAEDIVQEIFISLWEKRKTIDIERSIGGWLFVSSYNRSVNTLKKKLRESQAFKQMNKESIDVPGNESDISVIQLNILEKAITQLSPQQRKVFELCKLRGKSYEEAAAELHISKHTVKEYLSDAVAFIREYVKQYPELGIMVILLSVFG
ncbi:MAG: sigma-70 family RNA polymerase sigma factor [Bacteroidetes bacterium]|nr:sigma-70 family RNA polymerase sigma factor [Bacteroidota bacterium]MBS1929647.1 sigma-70 family RNA polymerase sigma factor [Bacteroidota bacterium]